MGTRQCAEYSGAIQDLDTDISNRQRAGRGHYFRQSKPLDDEHAYKNGQ